MKVHDWTRVECGIFHDFHSTWTIALRNSMNEGLLPEGYNALVEQHVGRAIPDLLTLHAGPRAPGASPVSVPPTRAAGTAVAVQSPRVRRKLSIEPSAVARRRSLAIRHVSGHRLVALLVNKLGRRQFEPHKIAP